MLFVVGEWRWLAGGWLVAWAVVIVIVVPVPRHSPSLFCNLYYWLRYTTTRVAKACQNVKHDVSPFLTCCCCARSSHP